MSQSDANSSPTLLRRPGPPPPPPVAHSSSSSSSSSSQPDPPPLPSTSAPTPPPPPSSSLPTPSAADQSGQSPNNELKGDSATPETEDDAEIERRLAREANTFKQELEIDRILSAFKLNPYDILDLLQEASEKDIKNAYRRKSLLIHPDKVKHERAVEAFDLLKKAEAQLQDPARRKDLDEIVMEARVLVLKELSLPISTPSDDPALMSPSLDPPFSRRLAMKTKEVMIDEEVRKRKAAKLQMMYEGAEAAKKEQAAEDRKRKAEEEARWEAGRENRVNDWRNFTKGGGHKKKKAKPNVLG